MGNVKGNALGGVKRFVSARHGAAGVSRWLECLSPQDAALVEGLILPHGWYPVRIWNRLLDQYVTLFGDGNPQSFRSVAVAIAEDDLQKYFKVLLKTASPAMLMQRAGSIWERYFDTGSMEGTEISANRFAIRLTAPRLLDRGPGPLTCTVGIPAWQERGLALAGARDARVIHSHCRFRNATACEFEVSWT